MTLDEFKQPDDWYKFDGCDYETAEDLLQTGFLGFCGCGDPEGNLEYIRSALEILAERFPRIPDREREQWDTWYKQHGERVLAHFGNDRSAYFFYYWADRNRLTEHGGSVPGWLTDKGKHFLKVLSEHKSADSTTGDS